MLQLCPQKVAFFFFLVWLEVANNRLHLPDLKEATKSPLYVN